MRWLLGWTQSGLAERAGITRQTLSALENERSRPQLATAEKLSEVLGEPISVLFPPGREAS